MIHNCCRDGYNEGEEEEGGRNDEKVGKEKEKRKKERKEKREIGEKDRVLFSMWNGTGVCYVNKYVDKDRISEPNWMKSGWNFSPLWG